MNDSVFIFVLGRFFSTNFFILTKINFRKIKLSNSFKNNRFQKILGLENRLKNTDARHDSQSHSDAGLATST